METGRGRLHILRININPNIMPEFWKSTRFWALVILALVGILESYSLMPGSIADALMLVLGGHVGIRTLDGVASKLGKK